MTGTKSPSAVAAVPASVSAQLGRRVAAENNGQEGFAEPPIRAELIGSDRCEAEGLSARGYAPVLELCRELVAAGFSPACPLEARRGEILCLRVRLIGESAGLTVADDRHGRHAYDAARTHRGMSQARPSRCPAQRTGPPRGLCHESDLLWRAWTSHGAYRLRARSTAAQSALPRRDHPRAARPLRLADVVRPLIGAGCKAAERLPMRRFSVDRRPRQAAPLRVGALPVLRASPRLGIARKLHVHQRRHQHGRCTA
jgi:hypothetical protein